MNSIKEHLLEIEKEWLELEDSIQNDPLILQKQKLDHSSNEYNETINELILRTKNGMLRQLEIVSSISDLIPQNTQDDFQLFTVFDDMLYISSEAKKLHKILENENINTLSDLTLKFSLKVFSLGFSRQSDGKTRFSEMIEKLNETETQKDL